MVTIGDGRMLAVAIGLFVLLIGAVTYMIAGPLLEAAKGRSATPEDLARGEALIRQQYGTAVTRVGRVTLVPAGLCAMRGSAELIEAGAARQASCFVSIGKHDRLSADCR